MSIMEGDLIRAIVDAGNELYAEPRGNLLKLDGYLNVGEAVETLNNITEAE